MKCLAAGSVSLALLFSACASQQQPPPPPPLKLVTESPNEPSATPPPVTGAQLLAQQPSEVQAAIKEHEQGGKWLVYRTAEHTLYPYDQEPQPAVDCAPLRTTDIQLQPGETITDVALGDTERWMATPAASGDPAQRRLSPCGEAAGSWYRNQPSTRQSTSITYSCTRAGARCRKSSSTIQTS